MKSIYIKFNSHDDINRFVNIVCRYDLDFDLVKGKNVIDAKSYLGILGFDSCAPLRLDIYADEIDDQLMQQLSSFVVDL